MKTADSVRLESNLADIRRLHIVGGPGSGKSTFAEDVGKLTGAPVYHLDQIAFEGPDFIERPVAHRRSDVHRIAVQPRWITEGIFVGWTEELFESADAIIWLDHVNWFTSCWRITKRFFRGAVDEAKRQPGARKFSRVGNYWVKLGHLFAEFSSSIKYYAGYKPGGQTVPGERSHAATQMSLATFQNKVIHCTNSEEVNNLLRRIVDQRLSVDSSMAAQNTTPRIQSS